MKAHSFGVDGRLPPIRRAAAGQVVEDALAAGPIEIRRRAHAPDRPEHVAVGGFVQAELLPRDVDRGELALAEVGGRFSR
ncbi:MAG: hypothetical protein M5R42_16785 [Rhodocyclaceae bacterium]|nr:hypothetical protein [Rhodocyclaceae bacterium]